MANAEETEAASIVELEDIEVGEVFNDRNAPHGVNLEREMEEE